MKLRSRRLPALVLLVLGAGMASAPAAAQGRRVFINTTEDLPPETAHCLPQQICPVRAAIERIEGGGGAIRVCYHPDDNVPGGKPCPGTALPLRTSDAGYDPATGKWTFEFGRDLPLVFSAGSTQVDFTLDIEGWDGPEDNKLIFAADAVEIDHAMVIESSNNVFKGFEIRGRYQLAALTVRESIFGGGGASHNQFGPGLIFAGISPGTGIRFSSPEVGNNRFIGNWCGVTGDGTAAHVAQNQEDCLQLAAGTHDNVIGGPDPADRNIFAASKLGAGVSLEDPPTIGNTIQGNWFGLDVEGKKVGNLTGISIKTGAFETKVLGNVMSGNQQTGIAIFNNSGKTEIRGNIIGESPDRSACIGNGTYGIQLSGQPSNSVIEENRIACNAEAGIVISGQGTRGNRVARNSITNNNGQAIRVGPGANGGIRDPRINNNTATRIVGDSCPGCKVDVYSDPDEEADVWEGSVAADAATGLFIFEKPEGFTHAYVKVTGTDPNNNTSGLSDKRSVPADRTPTTAPSATRTPTVVPVTTTPGTVEPTPTEHVLRQVFVPWTAKQHVR